MEKGFSFGKPKPNAEPKYAPNRRELRRLGFRKRRTMPGRRSGLPTGKGSLFTHMEQIWYDNDGKKRRIRFERPLGM